MSKGKNALADEKMDFICPFCKKRYGYASPTRVWIELCECTRGILRTDEGQNEDNSLQQGQ